MLIFSFSFRWKDLKKPRRPYEKERLDSELKLVGEYLSMVSAASVNYGGSSML